MNAHAAAGLLQVRKFPKPNFPRGLDAGPDREVATIQGSLPEGHAVLELIKCRSGECGLCEMKIA